jgi:uncharacterized protein YbjT (DUF2867 family)
MDRILVIGASGRVGRQVVTQLLTTNTRIRAVSRNPQSAGLPPQVDVMGGDLTMPPTLDNCLEGVDAVFLVWTAPPATVSQVIERIAKHARRIVFLSSPYQTAHPLFQASQPNLLSKLHAEIERLIRASGLSWTFLRPGMFAANAREWWADQIRKGDGVRWPYALSPTAPIDERDIAAVGVRALRDEKCSGAEYVITGPQSLTHREQVATIGDALGRPLRLEEISPEEWRNELPPFIPAPAANMLLAAWAAAVGQPALITSTVAEVLGRPAHTFLDWAKNSAADFR